jgi:hypothetical protein
VCEPLPYRAWSAVHEEAAMNTTIFLFGAILILGSVIAASFALRR